MYTFNAAVMPARKKINKLSTYQTNLAILAAVIVFGVAYLIQINSLSTKGYEIRQLEQKIKNLETQHKHLEVQSSNLQSITRIQQEAAKLNFVPVGQTVFIKDSDFALK